MGKGEEGMGTLFSRTTLAHAVAGSVGSIVAMAVTYPLDRVRTIKQLSRKKNSGSVLSAMREIVDKEGWAGLYAGLQPMLVALGTSNFVYFYWFTALRAILQYALRGARPKGSVVSDGGAFGNLALASVAGTLNVLITTPVWVAYTRLAVQSMTLLKGGAQPAPEDTYSGIVDAMRKISRRDGVASLWSGIGPSLILVSNPSVQFASYEWLKRALLKFRLDSEPECKDFAHFGDIMEDQTEDVSSEAVTGPALNSLEYLVLGATAKMIATVVTYPIQVAQTRMRAEAQRAKASAAAEGSDANSATAALPRAYAGTVDCLMHIYQIEGVSGLYRGMEAKLLQTCLTSAFMFAAYEKICAIILRALLWRKFSTKAVA